MDTNYNFANLVTRVQTKLKDVDYSEEDIKQFLNETYFEVLGETEYDFLNKISTYDAVTGGELDIPSDFQAAHQLVVGQNGQITPLQYVPHDEFFSRCPMSSRNSMKYTVYGKKIFFTLPGDAQLKNCDCDSGDDVKDDKFYTVRLFYLAKPQALENDDDVPVIPAEYGEILVLGALYRAEQLRDNFDFAQIYENKQQSLITNMNLRYGPKVLGIHNRADLPVRVNLGV